MTRTAPTRANARRLDLLTWLAEQGVRDSRGVATLARELTALAEACARLEGRTITTEELMPRRRKDTAHAKRSAAPPSAANPSADSPPDHVPAAGDAASGVLPPAAGVSPSPAAPEPPRSLAAEEFARAGCPGGVAITPSPIPLAELLCDRGVQAMDVETAERAAARVALHLYRGAPQTAHEALDDAWRQHLADAGALPTGEAIADEPLARVLSDVRMLNRLELAGMVTIGQFCESIEAKLPTMNNFGPRAAEILLALKARLDRLRGGVSAVASERPMPAPAASEAPRLPSAAPAKRRGRKPKGAAQEARKEVTKEAQVAAAVAGEMRAWCEQETVRLLPLIHSIAAKMHTPVPIEDLVQEGAKACFEALPRFDPNAGVQITTFVALRIRGAMLDYIRHVGKQTNGYSRITKVANVVESLDAARYEAASGRIVSHVDDLADDAPTPARHAAQFGAWKTVLSGFSQPERIMVLEYFVHGRTMREIGIDLGLSESRVSQMMTAILGRLREADARDGRVRELAAG